MQQQQQAGHSSGNGCPNFLLNRLILGTACVKKRPWQSTVDSHLPLFAALFPQKIPLVFLPLFQSTSHYQTTEHSKRFWSEIPDEVEFNSSDGSNYVQSSMFDLSKPKIGCWSSITKGWTRSSLSDVWKNYVRVCSMSIFVNLVKALLGSMFDIRSFKAKNWVFEFDHQ